MAAGVWIVDSTQDPEAREPALRLQLTGDAQLGDLRVGEPFELVVGDRKLALKLEALPTRKLDVDGLSFEYPRGMSYEYSSEGPGHDVDARR